MAVTEDTEREVRELRESAEEYADRVRAGEEPWREDPAWQEENEEQQAELESLPDVRNDDVGETGVPSGDSDSPETFDQEGDVEEDDGA
jgi:hypothetical protein